MFLLLTLNYVSHLFLAFLLLNLNKQMLAGNANCHFLIICLKDTCTEGSRLTAVDWFYSLLTLLLTSNGHSLVQTISLFENKNLQSFALALLK